MSEETQKFTYFAYGGNTNPNHMARKYPTATPLGTGYINSYNLVFRTHWHSQLEKSYCDIAENTQQVVHGVVYSLTQHDLNLLDVQEVMYNRIKVKVVMGDSEIEAYTYQMQDQSCNLAAPSARYFRVVSTGYKHHNLPIEQLQNAMFVSL